MAVHQSTFRVGEKGETRIKPVTIILNQLVEPDQTDKEALCPDKSALITGCISMTIRSQSSNCKSEPLLGESNGFMCGRPLQAMISHTHMCLK